MKAYIRATVAATLLFVLQSESVAASPLDDKIVQILAPGRGPIGAGVLVKHDVVLSAYHVVRGADMVVLQCGDGSPAIGLPFAGSEALDLVMIRLMTPCKGTRVSTLALSRPARGSDVFAIGCPGGVCDRATKGIVSSYEIHDEERGARLITDTEIWFGNSGGGLFDSDGSLLGICSAVQHMGVPRDEKEPTGDAVADWGVFIPPDVIRPWAAAAGVYL